MEPGSIALLPDDRVLVGTRRGELWICEGAYGDDLSKVTWKKYFDGMHEPLGMFWKEGALHYTDREQYGRLIDRNGDSTRCGGNHFRSVGNQWQLPRICIWYHARPAGKCLCYPLPDRFL